MSKITIELKRTEMLARLANRAALEGQTIDQFITRTIEDATRDDDDPLTTAPNPTPYQPTISNDGI